MLYLIGLGIWDEKDISLKGLETCRKADSVYAELYTARWGGSLPILEKHIGKKITVLERSGMEEDSQKLISEAKNSEVAVLIPGDPLTATTHSNLLLDARNQRINAIVIHSSSILTAVAESGLSLYNFGKIVSMPMPQANYKPTSFYDSIEANLGLGMHTLILLDIGMGITQAVSLLLKISKERNGKITTGTKAVAMSMIGSEKQSTVYGNLSDIAEKELPAPAVLILPGKMHFTEEEFLEKHELGTTSRI